LPKSIPPNGDGVVPSAVSKGGQAVDHVIPISGLIAFAVGTAHQVAHQCSWGQAPRWIIKNINPKIYKS